MAIECSSSNLATLAECFSCLPAKQKRGMQIAILANLLGIDPDPDQLAIDAECFTCLPIPQNKAFQIYLLCQLLS